MLAKTSSIMASGVCCILTEALSGHGLVIAVRKTASLRRIGAFASPKQFDEMARTRAKQSQAEME
jgi:hypothetical protein